MEMEREMEREMESGLPGICRFPKQYPAVPAITWAPRPVA